MSLVLAILGWLLATVGILLFVLLLIPVSAAAEGWIAGTHASGEVEFSWAWGLVGGWASPAEGVWLKIFGFRVYRVKPDKEKSDKKKRDKKKKGKKKRRKRKEKMTLAQGKKLMGLGVRLLKTLWFQGRIGGVVGMDEPAATAMLTESLGILDRWFPLFAIQVSPDWVDEVLELDGEVRFTIWPAYTVSVALAMLLRKETRVLLRSL